MSQAKDNVRPIIVVRRIKKVAGGHHGGAWKVAYADFVTAMMAFFMLLWLISSPDKEKLKGLADYFSPAPPNAPEKMGQTAGASAVTGSGGHTQSQKADGSRAAGTPAMQSATSGVARGGTANVPDSTLRVIAQELKIALDSPSDPAGTSSNVAVEPSPEGVRISLMDSDRNSMFVSGTARLNAFGQDLLKRLATKIAPLHVPVAIEGHTDSRGATGDANWRLSGDRALAARNALIGAGLASGRVVQVVALADTRPIYPDQPNRAENRRITVILVAEPSSLPHDISFRY